MIKWHLKCFVIELITLIGFGFAWHLNQNLGLWRWGIITGVCVAVMAGILVLLEAFVLNHVLFAFLVGLYLHPLTNILIAVAGAFAWLALLFALWHKRPRNGALDGHQNTHPT